MTDTVESDAALARILAEEEGASYGDYIDFYEKPKTSRRKQRHSSDDEDEEFLPGKSRQFSKNRQRSTINTNKEKKQKTVPSKEQSNQSYISPQEETEERKRKAPSKWTEEEEKRFLEALNLYGRDWQKCAQYMETRDANNFRSHAQKYFIRLYKQGLPVPPKVAETGEGHTLSGKPLDPNSAAARCYIYGKEYRKQLASRRESVTKLNGDEKENAENSSNLPNENEHDGTNTTNMDQVDEIEAQMLMDDALNKEDENVDSQTAKLLQQSNQKKSNKSVLQAIETIDYDEDGKTEYTRSRLRRVRTKTGNYSTLLQGNVDPSSELRFVETRKYSNEIPVGEAGSQPFYLEVDNTALLIMDFHAHLTQVEIIGFLGGYWIPEEKKITVLEAFPCRSLSHHNLNDDESVSVEMDPESEVEIRKDIEERGLRVVGWYHSHPCFRPIPSLRDLTNQQSYQTLFRDHRNSIEPFVGAIICPYDPRLVEIVSCIQWFYSDQNEPYLLSCWSTSNTTKKMAFDKDLLLQKFSRCLKDLQEKSNAKVINFDNSWKYIRSSGQEPIVAGSMREKLKYSLHSRRPKYLSEADFENFLQETLQLLPIHEKDEREKDVGELVF